VPYVVYYHGDSVKHLPELRDSSRPLFDMIFSAIRPRLLFSAIDLGVFELLTRPMSAVEVAEELGSHEENTRLFLDALASVRLLDKRDGRYTNASITAQFLTGGETDLTGALRNEWETSLAMMGDLEGLVMNGPSVEDVVLGQGGQGGFLVNYQRAGHAQVIRDMVTSLPEFRGAKRMLDLGSGPGLVSVALADEDPELRCVLFDRPSMAAAMRSTIERYGCTERFEAILGDYERDELGSGYDLVLTSFSLYNASDLVSMMERIRDALVPGGLFVSIHEGLRRERTVPGGMVLWNLTYALLREDKTFEAGEIASAMESAGLTSIRRFGMEMPYGQVEVTVGKRRSPEK
jgi:SAM-dependent methyltransferase